MDPKLNKLEGITIGTEVRDKKLTYVLSCLIKLEKLLCLKYFGSKSRANSGGFHTMKLIPLWLQETIEFVMGSSTISYVLVKKGAGAVDPPLDPSIIANNFNPVQLKFNSIYLSI